MWWVENTPIIIPWDVPFPSPKDRDKATQRIAEKRITKKQIFFSFPPSHLIRVEKVKSRINFRRQKVNI